MYCPKCGQQQLSDNSRFCSRCGIEISGVAEWLAGGVFPVISETAGKKSPRRKGISRGAKLMFFSGVMLPIFFAMSFAAENSGPLIVPLTIFFAGLALMLYARLFGEDTPAVATPRYQPPAFATQSTGPALPPANDARIHSGLGQSVRTAELARPPSVTEHTTRLLDKE